MIENKHALWIDNLACRLGFPEVSSLDSDRRVGFVFVLSLFGVAATLVGALLAVFVETDPDWESMWVLLVLGGICLVTLGFVRAGRPAPAAWILMLNGVAGTTILIFTGYSTGLDDVAIMLYAVLAVSASVMFDSRGSAIAEGVVVGSILLVLAVELAGVSASDPRRGGIIADAGFAVLIVVVTGATTYFLTASLRRSIAERQRHESALEQANSELEIRSAELEMRNAELERFTYTISHELKSPLVTIGGFLPYLHKSVAAGDLESIQKDLDTIQGAQQRMARLLLELLDLCRLGVMRNPAEELPVVELIQEAAAAGAVTLEENGLEVRISSDLPVVSGDKPRLVEVFLNLLENAARFTRNEPEPKVDIYQRDTVDGSILVLQDNGIGIDPRFHETVFDLFQKLDPGDTGTGVGLAIVRRIVELHGGRIWVESEGLGHGCRFCISLPWIQAARRS